MSDSTEPLRWYHGLAIAAAGLLLLAVVGTTGLLAIDALSGQPSAVETVTGESESEAVEILKDRPSPWEQFTALFTDPLFWVMMTPLTLFLVFLIGPYLEWQRRRLAQSTDEVRE